MTDEHLKGTLNKARGTVEDGLGKVTGDRSARVRGKMRRLQGSAQKGLGSIKSAVRRSIDRS